MTSSPEFIGVDDVRRAVDVDDLVEPMLTAFAETSAGHADNRILVLHPGQSPELGDVHVRTGVVAARPHHIVKVAPWFKVNDENGRRQGGLIVVLDSVTGHTRAVVDDHHLLTDLRTAAAAAGAALLLCHDDVDTMTMLGTGVQGRLQPPAIHRRRPFRRLLIWGRRPDRAEAAALHLQAELPDVEVRVEPDRRLALRAADLVATATPATSSLVSDDDVPRCRFIVASGADDPDKCELDAAVLRRADVFVDDAELATRNGSVHRAISAHGYSADLLAGQLGDVVRGEAGVDRSRSDLVVSAHVGVGAQDVLAVEVLLQNLGLS